MLLLVLFLHMLTLFGSLLLRLLCVAIVDVLFLLLSKAQVPWWYNCEEQLYFPAD
jgi:hypothetical protein